MNCPWKFSAKQWRDRALYYQWMFRFTLGALLLGAFLSMVNP